jgi:spermidine/putrescine transport system substrate-binding protein
VDSNRLFGRKMTRRSFLGTAAGVGAGLAASSALSPLANIASAAGGSFSWMTWNDHYFPAQIEEASTKYNIKANPTLFSDNSEAFLKVQQVGGKQIDMVSGDALWVPNYYKEKLIEPFDLWSLESSHGLFDVAQDMPFWKTADGMSMAFPFGWSPVVIAYNPKYVTNQPDSWDIFFDPKYKGKIAMELQPFDVMAMMGKSLGIDKAYNMSVDQIGQAKKQLQRLMPNILKFVEQNNEIVSLLADESIWMATVNLGIEERVKAAKGPDVKTFIPKEGVVGFIDGEMIVAGATNKDAAMTFLDKMETGDWLAKNFMENGRPLFSRDAYHILVKNGQGDRAKRYLMDKPEFALTMTLKGPSENMDATIKAFNEAIAGG